MINKNNDTNINTTPISYDICDNNIGLHTGDTGTSDYYFTWPDYNHYYYYHTQPTPSPLEKIDGKIENTKVLIKNLNDRISVIEQHLLRLLVKIEEVLDKVENKDGKV